MDSDYIIFGAPDIQAEEIEEVVDCLKSGWIGTGPKVAAFERDFAAYKNIPESQTAAVNSGTAALHLALLAADIGPGDEVITTAMTFCATINAIIHAGATPVLADIDATTGNIDPMDIDHRITSRTKAILPVHYSGLPCDMDAIMAIAQRHNLAVVEDCAHAIEAEYKGKKCGTIGDFGCFSFYATKNITTAEGGMVIAKNPSDINKIKVLSLHGLSADAWHRFSDQGYKHYLVTAPGFKYNMTDIAAALGIHQLARIDNNLDSRKRIWNYYSRSISDHRVTLPVPPQPTSKCAYHLFPVRIAKSKEVNRDSVMQALHELGIGTGVHYQSIPLHPYYQEAFSWTPEDYPNALRWGIETLSLPLSPVLTEKELARIVGAFHTVISDRYRPTAPYKIRT
ncbi:MAG: DegT/DnrJ/EryC1/StrS family aminotransferase [bacterium]